MALPMNNEFYSEPPRDSDNIYPEEGFPPSDLITYVRELFNDAYSLKYRQLSKEISGNNGSFLRENILPGGHESTRRTQRIVLEPPRPRTSNIYTEVYAINLRGIDGHETGDTSGYFADQYLIRDVIDGEPQELELITDDGVFAVDVNEFDIVNGYGVHNNDSSVLKPIDRAETRLANLKTMNLIATKD